MAKVLNVRGTSPSFDGPTPSRSLHSNSSWLKAQEVLRAVEVTSALKTLRDVKGMEIDYRNDLVHIKLVGEGAFGVVEKSKYLPQNRYVAVKKLKIADKKLTAAEIQDMKRETALSRKLRSQYIVEFLGSGHYRDQFGNDVHFMVQEFMDGGTLKKMVERSIKTKRCIYSIQDALRWLIDVAKGLQYLHQSLPMVIHRDMKLENILLTGTDPHSSRAKICDMGLSALVRRSHTLEAARKLPEADASKQPPPAGAADGTTVKQADAVHLSTQWSKYAKSRESDVSVDMRVHDLGKWQGGRVGTWLYMAPEVYRREAYDEKADVFSFAIIAYELIHRYRMSMMIRNKQDAEKYAQMVALNHFRPPLDEKLPLQFQALIASCWHSDAKQRPSMRAVAKELDAARNADWGRYEAEELKRYPCQSPCCVVS